MHSAKAYEVSLSGVKIVDPYNFERLNDYINKLVELRSKKGMTPEEAKKLLQTDPNFFGVMLVKMKNADKMVSRSASPRWFFYPASLGASALKIREKEANLDNQSCQKS